MTPCGIQHTEAGMRVEEPHVMGQVYVQMITSKHFTLRWIQRIWQIKFDLILKLYAVKALKKGNVTRDEMDRWERTVSEFRHNAGWGNWFWKTLAVAFHLKYTIIVCLFVCSSVILAWDDQLLPPSLPGEYAWLLPDGGPCVLCDGVLPRGRPHDPHTHQHLHWETELSKPYTTHTGPIMTEWERT